MQHFLEVATAHNGNLSGGYALLAWILLLRLITLPIQEAALKEPARL